MTSKTLWKQCGKKDRYPDEHRAQNYADKCMTKRPGQDLRVYDCSVCGGWHITSSPLLERGER